jgi:rhodanese-related sulfurtransferase
MDPMLRLITPQTLSDVVAGKFSDKLSRYIIVDCRFPFEYEGGHVAGAYNLWTLENVVAAFFMQQIIPLKEAHRCAVIFHCEFSSHRAPTQYINLRSECAGPYRDVMHVQNCGA